MGYILGGTIEKVDTSLPKCGQDYKCKNPISHNRNVRVVQYGAFITLSIFFKIQETPHSSPSRASYGVSFVSSKSMVYLSHCFAVVNNVLGYIQLHYNGTWHP